MEDIEDKLAAREKTVGDELASTQSDGCRVVSLEDLSEDRRHLNCQKGIQRSPTEICREIWRHGRWGM